SHRGHINVDVDAVKQGTGNLRNVPLDKRGSTRALARGIIEISAGAGIHGGGQHKARGESKRQAGAGDSHVAVLQRLSQDLEYVALELRQLVEEEHAVIRQTDFSGARHDTAANQARIGNRVVRRTERTGAHQAGTGFEHASHTMNLGGLDSLVKGKRRK